MPIIGTILYARVPSGVGVLTAGIILAIMIIPFIASITRDILDQVPPILRESAYGVGCTTWEVVRHVLAAAGRVSLVGAVMLGLGRALGETMAVTFVIGNANRLSPSIFDPGSTIASRIANEFNEADRPAAQRAPGARLHPVPRLLHGPRPRAPADRAREGPVEEPRWTPSPPMPRPTPTAPAWGRVRRGRHVADRALRIVCTLFTALGVVVLGWILLMLIVEGVGGAARPRSSPRRRPARHRGRRHRQRHRRQPHPDRPRHRVGTPIGVMAGTYPGRIRQGLEARRGHPLRQRHPALGALHPDRPLRLQLMVLPMGGFSGWAGGVALAIIAVPVIVRTTEDMLRLVPGALREAGAALGAPHVEGDPHLSWRAARAGIVTGVLLATARIAGETAPLLFTSLGNNFWFQPDLWAASRTCRSRSTSSPCSPYRELARARLGRRPPHYRRRPGAAILARLRPAGRTTSDELDCPSTPAAPIATMRPRDAGAPVAHRRARTSTSTTATTAGLKGINLDFHDRQVTALIGPSGCGKSTLLRMLNRMYSLYPDQRAEGEILLDGQNSCRPPST